MRARVMLALLIASLLVSSSLSQWRGIPNGTIQIPRLDDAGNTPLEPAEPVVPGVVLVGLKGGTPVSIGGHEVNVIQAGTSATLTALGAQKIELLFPNLERPPAAGSGEAFGQGAMDASRVYRLHLHADADIPRLIQELSAHPEVAFVELDGLMRATSTPNDALYPDQWGLAQIQAPAAWELVTGTSDVVIADVGSGLDTSHPDLVGQLWVNPGEVVGNGLDDDNNGYVDDIHGWNVLNDNADLSDNTGHSTVVAGVIVAAPNNKQGVTGLCWGCRLMVIKVTQPDGLARYSDIAEGIAYAARNGAHVINISLRGRLDLTTLRLAIAAASRTAVVVSGAGNDGDDTPVYPAGYDTVLAVASTDRHDVKLEESNYGTWVHVSAPGQDILTTSGDGYRSRSGTSVASAFVSGLAGLLRSQNPEWSPDAVRAQIIHTADDVDGLNPGFEGLLGGGRINAARAVTTAAQPLLSLEGHSLDMQPARQAPKPCSAD